MKFRPVVFFWIALAIVALVIAWRYIREDPFFLSITLGWIALVALLLWIGNRLLARSLERWLPWNRWGNIRFFTQLLLGLFLLLVLLNVSYVIMKVSATTDPPTYQQIVVMNAYGAFIFVPIFSIYFSLYFLKHWRESELAVARYREQQLKSQLVSLKNHLDPHFLFNNLNILSALVEIDPLRSREFINRFSDVYRWILKTANEDLISLQDEMTFINSYMFLIKTRFQENIRFTSDIPTGTNKMIPPLTLQMLIENAIKHNDIREDHPLYIDLKMGEDYLLVSNTILKKTFSEAGEGGSGLTNIRQRYQHFTNMPVKVTETASLFQVQIPLLDFEIAS